MDLNTNTINMLAAITAADAKLQDQSSRCEFIYLFIYSVLFIICLFV